MEQWVQQGKMKLYDLEEVRSNSACSIAIRFRLKGADAVVAEVADELGLDLYIFDKEIRRRFPKAREP